MYRAALRAPPQELEYGFSVWSLARLNAHLLKKTGIGFNDGQLGRIMKQEDYSFQRPKHTMEGKRDEAAFQKATTMLRSLKKKRSTMTLISH
jgi:transposase